MGPSTTSPSGRPRLPELRWIPALVQIVSANWSLPTGTAPTANRLFDPIEVEVVVLFGEKAELAVDAALDDVQRGFGKLEAGATSHVRWLKIN